MGGWGGGGCSCRGQGGPTSNGCLTSCSHVPDADASMFGHRMAIIGSVDAIRDGWAPGGCYKSNNDQYILGY